VLHDEAGQEQQVDQQKLNLVNINNMSTTFKSECEGKRIGLNASVARNINIGRQQQQQQQQQQLHLPSNLAPRNVSIINQDAQFTTTSKGENNVILELNAGCFDNINISLGN
jgi:hypothetical protein